MVKVRDRHPRMRQDVCFPAHHAGLCAERDHVSPDRCRPSPPGEGGSSRPGSRTPTPRLESPQYPTPQRERVQLQTVGVRRTKGVGPAPEYEDDHRREAADVHGAIQPKAEQPGCASRSSAVHGLLRPASEARLVLSTCSPPWGFSAPRLRSRYVAVHRTTTTSWLKLDDLLLTLTMLGCRFDSEPLEFSPCRHRCRKVLLEPWMMGSGRS